jgi:hypothetical protein
VDGVQRVAKTSSKYASAVARDFPDRRAEIRGVDTFVRYLSVGK